MASQPNMPAIAIMGFAGLCLSVACGIGLGSYTATGISPMDRGNFSMTRMPDAGVAASSNGEVKRAVIAVSMQSDDSDWVGQQDGRSDTTSW